MIGQFPIPEPSTNGQSLSIGNRSLEIAISQLGVCEQPKGSNGGPQVTQYLKSVGLGAGYAWCMAFVHWCVARASEEQGIKNPLLKTAGVMMQYNGTVLRKLPKTSSSVKPGDIFIMQFAHGTGHTGFVKEVKKGYIVTVEGNTNDDGSREGYEVAERERPLSSIYGFIQLP